MLSGVPIMVGSGTSPLPKPVQLSIGAQVVLIAWNINPDTNNQRKARKDSRNNPR